MYSNKFVACVKADGKVLREKGEEVFMPFGSEYTLWFKNENDRKVQIDVSIDGTDVLFGKALLLGAGETIDLKGFVRDIDGDDNRAFKFITKTQQISDFRGDKIEDGLIKIKYTFEREQTQETVYRNIVTNRFYNDYYTSNTPYTFGSNQYPTTKGGYSGDINASYSSFDTLGDDTPIATASTSYDTPVSKGVTRGMARGIDFEPSADPGITVEGSATNQSFQTGHIGPLESKTHTMIFQLKGLTETEVVEEPITVKTKKQCTTCGKLWSGNYEYCPNDGTYLRFV